MQTVEATFCVTDDHVQGYLESLRSRQFSEQTLLAYQHELKELQGALKESSSQASPVGALRAHLAQARGAGLKPSSLARRLAAWRSFLRWLAQTKLGAASQAALFLGQLKALRPPRPGRPLPRLLSVEEAVALAQGPGALPLRPIGGLMDDFDSMPMGSRAWCASWAVVRDRAAIELLYSCGLRVSELTGLDTQPSGPWTGWLDLQASDIVVVGKGNKLRRLPVGGPALQALQAWLDLRAKVLRELHLEQDKGPVFINRSGERMNRRAVHRLVQEAAEKLKLSQPVHPHMLRHSFASHLLQSSGDLRAVQELLGHAQITTTQVYTHLDFQRLAQVYDKAHPRARRKIKGFGTIGP